MDSEGNVIYVGKAKDLHKRVAQYFVPADRLTRKTAVMVSKIADALLLENNLIKQFKPRYNILLKDSKTYPWICVTADEFPKVILTRREMPNIKAVYEQYKDKGFEVLSLAVWERKPQSHTIETAAELGMDWLHVNNCGTVPTDIYGVEGIPHLMLIGPDGTILKRGFHGLEGIQAAVSEYLK